MTSARRCSSRWGTCFSRRRRTGWERLRNVRSCSDVRRPVEEVDAVARSRPAHGRCVRRRRVLGGRRCRAGRRHARAGPARGGARRRRARTDRRARAAARRARRRVWGRRRTELVAELPIRPLCRQLVDVGPVDDLPADLPMTIEDETTFHFRRRGETLRLAMTEPEPRWTSRGGGRRGARRRLARSASRTAFRRRRPRRSCARGRGCTT